LVEIRISKSCTAQETETGLQDEEWAQQEVVEVEEEEEEEEGF
jgi:hypothetical protein